eukprot:CAMPEP_0197716222 /NCGR_PEP_ID=MMETSP1434-20131217/1183_1 /TAXON_ID=265543 /ORGANISM="Minutocellus polymorphus, Strain CCMP3303" /LENGTH=362 /DNA_ID=CAMNT_0043300545 /DNA_START=15 /DNA_END=1100 /DNA_ORIENTATION=-
MAGPISPPSPSPGLTEPLLGGSNEGNGSAPVPSLQERRRNTNIKFILLYTVFMFAGRSMWSQTVLSAYVYLLRDDNAEAVGLLTAIMGISQLLLSFPTGYLADKFRRDTLLKSASIFGFVAISTTLVAVHRRSYSLLALALAFWGALWGVVYTTISALFADSVPDGKRSLWFTRRVVLIKLGNMVGPVVVLVMFYMLGDKWSVNDCSVVMMFGQAVCVIPLLLLCWMKDVESHEGDDSLLQSNDPEQAQDLLPRSDEESTEADASQNEVDEETPSAPLACFCLSKERFIPRMVACADILSGIAAGMSIRYFPIFFLSNLQLSPVLVQILFFFSVVGQIPLSIVAQRGAKRIGRCQMTVLFKW